MNNLKPAVFLDRDGTLIVEIGYIKNIEDVQVIEGAREAVKKLNDNGIYSILVSNQSGVARGYFDISNVDIINNEMLRSFKKIGAFMDGIYFCPHHPDGKIEQYALSCNCRKPSPGLIIKALEDFKDIDIDKSYMIGDKMVDVELAINAGCKGVLVKTGYGADIVQNSKNDSIKAHYIAESIKDAVDWVLEDLGLVIHKQ